jgi:hypothetical protein
MKEKSLPVRSFLHLLKSHKQVRIVSSIFGHVIVINLYVIILQDFRIKQSGVKPGVFSLFQT